MPDDHLAWMQAAIVEGELARGTTGDNPWVGCVIVGSDGQPVARGHTQGPGEDHAEIAALRRARASGLSLQGATLYSTLEPCSFHGRTPACARVIGESGVARLVLGMRDPHPRVDGAGARLVQEAGLVVLEGVAEPDVRRQLGPWVFAFHPHEPRRRALALRAAHSTHELITLLAALYNVDPALARALVDSLDEPTR